MDNKQLQGKLKLAKPSTLRVLEAGVDLPELIEISTKRDRWSKAVHILAQKNWLRIDCLDRQGRTVDTIVDEDQDQAELAIPGPQTQEERWLAIMINAQRLALESQATQLAPLIDGYVRLADILGRRLESLERHYDETLQVAAENALLQAQIEGGDDPNTEIVKQLIDKLGGDPKQLLAKATKAKKNGVKPK